MNFFDHNLPGIHWTPTDQWTDAVAAYNQVLSEEVDLFLAHRSSNTMPQRDAPTSSAPGGSNVHAVLQPFMMHVPVMDSTVEHFDCFHPGPTLAANMSVALFNSMVDPTTPKRTTIDFAAAPVCPTANTRLH
jgi:hypothetical protein